MLLVTLFIAIGIVTVTIRGRVALGPPTATPAVLLILKPVSLYTIFEVQVPAATRSIKGSEGFSGAWGLGIGVCILDSDTTKLKLSEAANLLPKILSPRSDSGSQTDNTDGQDMARERIEGSTSLVSAAALCGQGLCMAHSVDRPLESCISGIVKQVAANIFLAARTR